MVALARFVIVTKYARAIANECKAVLETMATAAHRTRDTLDHDFDECAVIQHMPLVNQQLRLHVGESNSIP